MVNILKTKYYTTVIPLIVINEIDKLTKINIELSDECAEHAVSVKKNAFIAMNFLNSEFEKKNHNLKAMTSHGTLLETIQFRSEEIIKKGSNDELILGCCLYYCKDKETSESKNVPKNQSKYYFNIFIL
jgi:protein SMG6